MNRVIPGLDYLAVILSSSVNTGQLRLVRSIRLARALRGIRIVWLFEYVSALRTLALSIVSTWVIQRGVRGLLGLIKLG